MRKTKNKHHKFLLLLSLLAVALMFFFRPAFIEDVVMGADYSIIILVLLYLPGFLILVGLIEVWLPEKFVVSHLGKHSGLKGSLYSFGMGSVIVGPLYLAFPLAAMLLRKGVSRFNVALFVGAWSSFKIGEEVFELQFLGLRFLLLRVLLSIPFVILSAYILDRIHFKADQT